MAPASRNCSAIYVHKIRMGRHVNSSCNDRPMFQSKSPSCSPALPAPAAPPFLIFLYYTTGTPQLSVMFFYLALFLPIGYNRGSGGMIVGKIVLYLAMSVDGYIADEQGGVSWLEGDGSKPDTSGSYPAFYETVEAIVMGWTTYHQISHGALSGHLALRGPPLLCGDPPAERKSGECLLLEWGTDRPGPIS